MDTARDEAIRILQANLCSVGVSSRNDVARAVDLIIDAAAARAVDLIIAATAEAAREKKL